MAFKQILTSIFFLSIIGLVQGQSSKPTFLIKSNDSIKHQDFEIISTKISERFIDRGFIPIQSINERDEKKEDLNVYVTFKNNADSITLAIEIVENCWNTIIVSYTKIEKNNNNDYNVIISEVSDMIFSKLMDYYTDMVDNGRIIKLTIKSLVELDTLIDTKTGTKKLEDLLNEFIQSKSVDKPQVHKSTSFEMVCKLRIPMRNNEGKSIGIKNIVDDLNDFLKGIPFKKDFHYDIKSDYEVIIEI